MNIKVSLIKIIEHIPSALRVWYLTTNPFDLVNIRFSTIRIFAKQLMIFVHKWVFFSYSWTWYLF